MTIWPQKKQKRTHILTHTHTYIAKLFRQNDVPYQKKNHTSRNRLGKSR